MSAFFLLRWFAYTEFLLHAAQRGARDTSRAQVHHLDDGERRHLDQTRVCDYFVLHVTRTDDVISTYRGLSCLTSLRVESVCPTWPIRMEPVLSMPATVIPPPHLYLLSVGY